MDVSRTCSIQIVHVITQVRACGNPRTLRVALMSAPRSSSSATISVRPFSAAMCNGVPPQLSCARRNVCTSRVLESEVDHSEIS